MEKRHSSFFAGGFTAKRLLLLCLAVLLCAMVYLQLRHDDYYAVEGLHNRLAPTDALAEYLTEHPSDTGSNVALGETSFEGERYRTDEFVLFNANYHLTINYSYEGAQDAALLLKDINLLAEDNTASVIFMNQPLVPGVDQQIVVPLRVETTRNAVIAALSAPSSGRLTVNNLTLQTVRPYFTDALLMTLFVALLAAALWWLCLYARTAKARLGWVTTACICFLIAAAASLPHYQMGMPAGHDLGYHAVRLEGLQMSFTMGKLFAHMNPFVFRGFGSADCIYYPDLFLTFPALLRVCHVSLLLAYKALFFATNFLTVLCAYVAAHRFCGKRIIALFFASIYTFALYRMMNVYTRGAVGEVLAMAFLPLVLYGIHSVFYAEKKEWLALAFGMVGLVGNHVTSLFLAGLLLVVYCVVQFKKLLHKPVLWALCKAGLLTVGLSMTWLLPFLVWMQYPNSIAAVRPTEMTFFAAQPAQMFASFAFSPTGNSLTQLQGVGGEMPLSLGILVGLGVLLYLLARYFLRSAAFETQKGLRVLGNTCLVGFCVCFYAATPLFPYTLLAKLGKADLLINIQFAWRFLGPATLFGSVLTAIAVGVLLPKIAAAARPLVAFALIVIPFLFCMPYLDAYTNTAINFMEQNNNTQINADGGSMYMPQLVVHKASSFPTITSDEKTLVFSACGREPMKVWFSFENPTDKEQTIRVPLYYFPNARAVLSDGTPLETQMGPLAEFLIKLPKGLKTGSVTADFALPWYFHFGDTVSLLTWLGVGAWSCRALVRRRAALCRSDL